MNGGNQKIDPSELKFIRLLDDFDLTMLVSEIHDHGWPVARETLEFMRQATSAELRRRGENYKEHADTLESRFKP